MRLYSERPARPIRHWVCDAVGLLALVAVGVVLVLLGDAILNGSQAAQPNDSAGWQVHVVKPNGRTIAIGSPFPDRRVCEEVRVPIMLEFISDITECRWVERDRRFG